jgi:oligopeptidase B
MKKTILFSSVCLIFATSCKKEEESKMTNAIQPPVAKIEPTVLEKHGHQRIDNYFWLNQREIKKLSTTSMPKTSTTNK